MTVRRSPPGLQIRDIAESVWTYVALRTNTTSGASTGRQKIARFRFRSLAFGILGRQLCLPDSTGRLRSMARDTCAGSSGIDNGRGLARTAWDGTSGTIWPRNASRALASSPPSKQWRGKSQGCRELKRAVIRNRCRATSLASTVYATFTSIALDLGFSVLGRWTTRMPSLKSAVSLSSATFSGSVNDRKKLP